MLDLIDGAGAASGEALPPAARSRRRPVHPICRLRGPRSRATSNPAHAVPRPARGVPLPGSGRRWGGGRWPKTTGRNLYLLPRQQAGYAAAARGWPSRRCSGRGLSHPTPPVSQPSVHVGVGVWVRCVGGGGCACIRGGTSTPKQHGTDHWGAVHQGWDKWQGTPPQPHWVASGACCMLNVKPTRIAQQRHASKHARARHSVGHVMVWGAMHLAVPFKSSVKACVGAWGGGLRGCMARGKSLLHLRLPVAGNCVITHITPGPCDACLQAAPLRMRGPATTSAVSCGHHMASALGVLAGRVKAGAGIRNR